MLQIYNTLSRKKEVFKPINAGEVSMYVCGMTVYDLCHVGHARVLVAFDVVTRYLRAKGYKVNYVRNITDVDDKIIKRANDNGELFTDLTERMIGEMHKDSGALGVLPPDREPKATEFIEEMKAMITVLIDKGYAYAPGNGDVYYRVAKFEGYGKLSGKILEELQAGARIGVDEMKEDPLDFVLWKGAKEGEPYWESPWSNGRPGWHIECSAMGKCCLGTFTAVVLISSSHTMRTRLPKARPLMAKPSSIPGCMPALCGWITRRCRRVWATSSLFGKCWINIQPKSCVIS